MDREKIVPRKKTPGELENIALACYDAQYDYEATRSDVLKAIDAVEQGKESWEYFRDVVADFIYMEGVVAVCEDSPSDFVQGRLSALSLLLESACKNDATAARKCLDEKFTLDTRDRPQHSKILRDLQKRRENTKREWDQIRERFFRSRPAGMTRKEYDEYLEHEKSNPERRRWV